MVPKDDVAERLTQEIAQRAHIQSRNMAGENSVELPQHWVSAKPGDFATQTLKAMDDICTLLRQNAAKSFEIVFRNTKHSPNEWGDRVLLAVRYDRAD